MVKKIFLASTIIISLIMVGCAPKDKTSEDPENEKFKSSLEQQESDESRTIGNLLQ